MNTHDKYPPNWDSIRKQVYENANRTCERCGATDIQLHAHHNVPLHLNGSNTIDNLECLCFHCHSLEHNDNPDLMENCIKEYSIKLSDYGINYNKCNNCLHKSQDNYRVKLACVIGFLIGLLTTLGGYLLYILFEY